jgi:hypothetical protein
LIERLFLKKEIVEPTKNIKGRGAQKNVHNRFLQDTHETRSDFLEYCHKEGEEADKNKTIYINTFPKTIVNKVESPDVGMEYS